MSSSRAGRRMLAIACGVTAGLVGASPALGAELGRLFLAPERRVALERQRGQASAELPAEAALDALTINGVVRRARGGTTVWLNGRARRLDELPEGMRASPTAGRPATLAVAVGEAAAVNLRVGETHQRTTGATLDVLPQGALRVAPSRAGPGGAR